MSDLWLSVPFLCAVHLLSLPFSYYNIVNNPLNSVPASSLFAAYQFRYRYTKLLQMAEKVLLVIVTLFVPSNLGSLNSGGQIIWASIIIIAYLATLLIIRPYNDPLGTRNSHTAQRWVGAV